jgi:hypothetical protein
MRSWSTARNATSGSSTPWKRSASRPLRRLDHQHQHRVTIRVFLEPCVNNAERPSRAQRDHIARTPTAPSLRRRAPCRVGHSPIFLCPRGRDRACHRAPGAPEPRARRRQSSRMGSFPTRLMADRHLQRVLVLSAARPRRTTQRRRSDHTSDSCDHNAAAQPLESTLLNLSIASTSDDVQF